MNYMMIRLTMIRIYDYLRNSMIPNEVDMQDIVVWMS